jgi:hypothetical protein
LILIGGASLCDVFLFFLLLLRACSNDGGIMAFLARVCNRYANGSRRGEQNVEYSLVATSPDSSLQEDLEGVSLTNGDRETYAFISWRTSPTFEILFNLDRVQHLLIPSLLALLPSFVRPSVRRAPRKLFPTSYLDGLRGIAALFVVIHHYALTCVFGEFLLIAGCARREAN